MKSLILDCSNFSPNQDPLLVNFGHQIFVVAMFLWVFAVFRTVVVVCCGIFAGFRTGMSICGLLGL